MGVLDGARRVCFFHAHPDDETLATGALIALLVADGVDVSVVTATRGERGEVVAGPLKMLEGTPGLVLLRERELAEALAALGVGMHAFLGTAPARAEGLPRRVYRDSGMRWVTPTIAGPSLDAGPDSLTSASVSEAAADLAAFLAWWRPDVLITYDELGGYGHPDHVACHHIAAAAVSVEPTNSGVEFPRSAVERLETPGSGSGVEDQSPRSFDLDKLDQRSTASTDEPVAEERSLRSERQRASRRVADEPVGTMGSTAEPVEAEERSLRSERQRASRRVAAELSVETPTRFVQVVSEPRLGSVSGQDIDGSQWLDTVKAALRCHASQLTVDGDDVVHSGGQRQPIVTRVTLL